MVPTSRIEIDLSALDHNVAQWRSVLGPDCEICAVLKADAYGLGAVQIARRIVPRGVKTIAVYSMPQASELAAMGLPATVLILMPVEDLERTDPLYRSLIAGRLHLTVHSLRQLELVEAIGLKYGSAIPVHIELDTGLSRLGMTADELPAVLHQIAGKRYVKLAGVFSHAASAGEDPAFTDQQLDKLEAILREHAGRIPAAARVHFAGTLAALRGQRFHQKMVRLGMGLLGYGEHAIVGPPHLPSLPELRPSVRWVSQIVHVRHVPPGITVGYQRSFTTPRPTRLGIVPVGYADGYPLSLSNRGVLRVGVNLQPAPIRGQVNMDQIAVDLTDLPHADVGTDVELVASDPKAANALPSLARLAQTSVYEMLCRLSPRTTRRYITLDTGSGMIGHVATITGGGVK